MELHSWHPRSCGIVQYSLHLAHTWSDMIVTWQRGECFPVAMMCWLSYARRLSSNKWTIPFGGDNTYGIWNNNCLTINFRSRRYKEVNAFSTTICITAKLCDLASLKAATRHKTQKTSLGRLPSMMSMSATNDMRKKCWNTALSLLQ